MTLAPREKFEISKNTLIVHAPFALDDYQNEEELFLRLIDQLVNGPVRQVRIDLLRAGCLSSTVIALSIAAHRKAEEAGKQLQLRVSQRNRLAVQICKLDQLIEVEFV